MKDYYQNKVNIAETLLKLAKHGFVETMHEYADKFKKVRDYEETMQVISELNIFIKGIKEMEDNLTFAQEQLQAEIDKEDAGRLS